MTKTKDDPPFVKRVSWIVLGGLAIAVLLLSSAFSQVWHTNEALQAQIATSAPMLTAEVETKATLQARLAYVRSDAYVEEWAREHAGMVRPGEVLVVPLLPTPTLTPVPTPTPILSTPTPMPFWARWWSQLTGR